MRKFGHPATIVGELDWWSVLYRRKQPTLGALVLAARCDVAAFSELPPEAFAELSPAVRRLEATLRRFSSYDKVNYLMLMMVDREPHFHVIPRYEAPRSFEGVEIADRGWPGPPALDSAVSLPPETEDRAIGRLRALWAETA
jgi:diadenosine tetraphosphate (Ap4A) HIT family hydrolase